MVDYCLRYELASFIRYCKKIYLVKIRISFELALSRSKQYYTIQKLEKSNA